MSKGSKRRPVNRDKFSKNFDNIKWSGETKYANRKRQPPPRFHHVIPDIQPYKAVAGDMAGKYITSRSQHREFLKRNDFTEVGNEKDYFFKNDGKTDYNPTKDWEG
jgi:hypothetical protein